MWNLISWPHQKPANLGLHGFQKWYTFFEKKEKSFKHSELILSYDDASGSEITPCNKIDKPLVVYRFTGNVMTSITTLRT